MDSYGLNPDFHNFDSFMNENALLGHVTLNRFRILYRLFVDIIVYIIFCTDVVMC